MITHPLVNIAYARLVGLTTISVLMFGCVGSPVHSTIAYNSVQSTIKTNNENLLKLRVGIMRGEVEQIMGKPERSEGYKWGTAWLYRTAMTSGIYGTEDSDFTPVVFSNKDILLGWGRNFLVARVKRYEVVIKK